MKYTPSHLRRLAHKNVRLEIAGLVNAVRYERVRANYPSLREVEEGFRAHTGDYAPFIVRDVWAGFNDPDLPTDRKTQGNPVREVIEWCEDQVARTPGYLDLCEQAEANVIGATFATAAFIEVASALDWPTPPSQDSDTQECTREDEEAGTKETRRVEVTAENKVNVTQIVEETGEGGEGQGPSRRVVTKSRQCGSAEEAQALAAQVIKQAQASGYSKPQKVEATLADFEEAVEGMLDNLANKRGEVREKAAEIFADAAEQAEEASEGFRVIRGRGVGAGDDGLKNPTENDVKVALELATNRRFLDFVKLVGRFLSGMTESVLRERVEGIHSPVGVVRTREIQNVLPTELALTNVPVMGDYQMMRIMEGKALGYKKTTLGTRESGPVHIALDKSGSMGNGEDWKIATAFATAAALFAADNQRPVSVCLFDDYFKAVPCDLSNPEGRTAFVKTMMTRTAGGGTSFTNLTRGIVALNLPPQADVLLISDGADGGELWEGGESAAETRALYAERDLSYIVIGDLHSVAPLLAELAGPRTVVGQDLLSSGATELAAAALRSK